MVDPVLSAVAIVTVALLVVAVLSGYIKNRLYISEPVIFLLLGILLGPKGFGMIDLGKLLDEPYWWLEQAARITVAISVMGAALRLPTRYVSDHRRELAVILSLGIVFMWAASTAVVYAVYTPSLLVALLIGAIITPTDPVLAGTVVTGRIARDNVPGRMRNSITSESGLNDGLGLVIVMLPLLLLLHPPATALQDWVVHILIKEIILAVLVGLGTGLLAGKAFHWAHRQPLTEPSALVTIGVALTLATLALVRSFNGAGILAVFVAGTVFNRYLVDEADEEHSHFQEAISRFLDLPIFFLFGLALPLDQWLAHGWQALGLALGVLFLRRLPAWFLLSPRLDSLQHRREVWFNGWFGPIGIAALFYSTMAYEKTHNELIWTVGSLAVFTSILVHGVLATPLTRLLGRALAANNH